MSDYTVRLRRFQMSGQGDADAFPLFAGGKHIMYLHCFATKHPAFTSLATRLLPEKAMREAVVTSEEYPENTHGRGITGYGRGRKRQHSAVEVIILGLDRLTAAVSPCSPGTSKRTERAESRKATSEALTCILRTLSQLDKSIQEAKIHSAEQRMMKKS
jgi:hypothetical protein